MAAGWRVTAQRQTTDLGPDGRFTDVMEVTFRTDVGVTANVRVPLAEYSAERVRAQITDYVDHIGDVSGLSG